MTDLVKALGENRRSAINFLKCVDGNIIEFDNSPYVLVSDDDMVINDMCVTKACLNNDGEIELYIEDWDMWVNDSECLSTTANNVYEMIEEQIFGD